MPASALEKLDPKTRKQILTWVEEFVRFNKVLPTDAQLQGEFENPNLSLKEIEPLLTDAEIADEEKSVEEKDEKKEKKETEERIEYFDKPETKKAEEPTPEESPTTDETKAELSKESAALKASKTRKKVLGKEPLISPRRKIAGVSAQAVFAELKIIEPKLQEAQKKAAEELAQSLNPKVREIVASLKIKGVDEARISQIAQEISAQVAQDTVEDVGKIESPQQISEVISKNLTENILTHPEIEPNAKIDEQKLYEQSSKATQEISQNHQKDLETVASLTTITETLNLKNPDQEVLELIADQAQQAIELDAPLALEDQKILEGSLKEYLVSYAEKFREEIAPQIAKGEIPSFETIQKAKEKAHEAVVPQVQNNFKNNPYAIQFAGRLSTANLTNDLSYTLGTRPMSQAKRESLGLGQTNAYAHSFSTAPRSLAEFRVGVLLSTPAAQKEVYYSLLAHNEPKLLKTLSDTEQRILKLRQKSSLSYRDRKQLKLLQNKFHILQEARQFSKQQTKKLKAYLGYFSGLPSGFQHNWASTQAWNVTNTAFGNYPGLIARRGPLSAILLANRTSSGITFGLNQMRLPSFATTGKITALGKLAGSITNIGGSLAMGTVKEFVKATAKVFGGLGLYFMGLGQAALTGFMIGATIGGTAGAIGGAYLGLSLGLATAPFFGPFAIITVPVFTALGAAGGFFFGGSIGGSAGALIAIGLASGSVTAVSSGIGMAGGAVGGGILGAKLGAVVGTFIAPGIGTAIGAVVGAVVGAVIGALVGAGIGYAIGKYVLTPLGNFIGSIGSFVTRALSAGVNAGFSLIGSLAKLAAIAWNGLSSVVGLGMSTLSGAASLLTSLGSISFGGTFAIVSVGGAITGVVAVSIFLTTILIPAIIGEEPKAAQASPTPSPTLFTENPYVTVEEKVSAPDKSKGPAEDLVLIKDDIPTKLRFKVTVKAKRKLSNLRCSEKTIVTTKSATTPITLSFNPPCPTTLNAGETHTLSADYQAAPPDFVNSSTLNTFTVEGEGETGGINLDYIIPFRETNVVIPNEAAVKNQVATNPNWPNNFVNTECEPGLNCWDYVKRESVKSGVNPAFVLAVWIAESGASHYSGHLSCPAGGEGIPRTVEMLKQSVSCFVNGWPPSRPPFLGASKWTADQFGQMLDAWCDPTSIEICQEPPDPPKTFLATLKDWYPRLVPPGNPGALSLITPGAPGTTVAFTPAHGNASVTIGESPGCAPKGIPLKDPWKITSEFGPAHPLGVDIADGGGATAYSTFPCVSEVTYADWLDETGRGGYGYLVRLKSGSFETYSGHMSHITVRDGQKIPPFGEIGPMDSTGYSSGNHVHYEVRRNGIILDPHDYGIPYKPINEY